MKLVTFQSFDALKHLINNGYLECNEKYIDINKNGVIYQWIVEKMNNKIINENKTKYPIWCWIKCYNGICPPKHKGNPVDGFDVKITFNKNESEVLITDFRRYSFLLNNMYIPKNIQDKNNFEKLLNEKKITKEELKAFVRKDKYKQCRQDSDYLEICNVIKNSFDRCITKESDILQGCVWKINLDEVETIEILPKDGYRYGSLNYIRSNGKRIDWIEEFYKNIDKKEV